MSQAGLVIASPILGRPREANQPAYLPKVSHLGPEGWDLFLDCKSKLLSPAELSVWAGEMGEGQPHLVAGETQAKVCLGI